MVIDRDADRPVHKQLVDILRDQIDSGALPPGSVLPSEIYLAQTYELSKTAVRRALELLLNEGLITKTKGKPTTVRERPQRKVMPLEPGDEVNARMPTEAERRSLGMPVGEPVFEVSRHGGTVDVLPAGTITLRAS
ncbi:GntR family transcriptional regulator [Dactylosporangium roseum]|uniref:GntR family transcriptional regulator n=1 Tax=Dactylosporangium roseum TaxID=47989 RepID=A0ABY5Z4W0_9ACTN|nr:GntR family transcriptional regulator [Dactylosporangium roseum]UWZ37086.1 GntR family transcriptional regulator [Dactylosporangium roseum]